MIGNDCSEVEIDAAVASYLEMISYWLHGISFLKTSYNKKIRTGVLMKRSRPRVPYAEYLRSPG